MTLVSDTLDDTAVLAVHLPVKEELEVELLAGRVVEEAKMPLLRNPVSEEFEAKLVRDVNVLLAPVGIREELGKRVLPRVFVTDVGPAEVRPPEKDNVEGVVSAGRLANSVEVLWIALPAPDD